MARTRIRRISTGPRRMTQWFAIQIGTTAVAAGGATLLASLNAAALADRPFTLVRAIGTVHMSGVGPGLSSGAFAIAQASEAAVTAGIGSLPTPITEGDANVFQTYLPLIGEGYQYAAAGTADIMTEQVFHFDSKAMRKINTEDNLAVVAESLAGAFNLTVVGRLLVKAH